MTHPMLTRKGLHLRTLLHCAVAYALGFPVGYAPQEVKLICLALAIALITVLEVRDPHKGGGEPSYKWWLKSLLDWCFKVGCFMLGMGGF